VLGVGITTLTPLKVVGWIAAHGFTIASMRVVRPAMMSSRSILIAFAPHTASSQGLPWRAGHDGL
jgi:hypothetical protein